MAKKRYISVSIAVYEQNEGSYSGERLAEQNLRVPVTTDTEPGDVGDVIAGYMAAMLNSVDQFHGHVVEDVSTEVVG